MKARIKMKNQITFPHIVAEKHPLADGSHLINSEFQEPDDDDLKYADEILKTQGLLADTSDGAWKWIHDNKKKDYVETLKRGGGGREHLACILRNFFRMDASFGISGFDYNQWAESALLLDIDTWQEFTEQVDLSILAMPDIGNPRSFLIDGILIDADQPRFNYHTMRIKGLSPLTVLEIGGGYGGLARQLKKQTNIKYVDVDLPETLYLTYYFLSKSGLDVKWALHDIPEADVVLVPADRKHLIKGLFDVVFNSYSLSEMGKSSSDEYLHLINTEWQPRYFFHENSNFLLFPDSERHIEILARDFPIDKKKYRKVYQAVSPWQGSGGRGREFLYQRID